MNIRERCSDEKIYKKTLDKIAKDISELDFSDVPDDDYFEACCLVGEDLYGASWDEAYEIAEIIQEKYL